MPIEAFPTLPVGADCVLRAQALPRDPPAEGDIGDGRPDLALEIGTQPEQLAFPLGIFDAKRQAGAEGVRIGHAVSSWNGLGRAGRWPS
ncbi:hypothetical protein D3C87_1575040 [compost metagenome]